MQWDAVGCCGMWGDAVGWSGMGVKGLRGQWEGIGMGVGGQRHGSGRGVGGK